MLLGTLSTLVVGAADIPSGVFHALKKGFHSRHNSVDTKPSSDTNSIPSDRKQFSSTSSSASLENEPSESPKDQNALTGGLTEVPEEISLLKETSIESEASSISLSSAETSDSHHKHHHHHHLHEHLSHAKRAASHVAEIGLAVPMDFANSLAQGFHNVPKLYQDHTVRPQENITGMKSGLQAARKDFRHGIYDGVTGVVTQPVHGAMEEGALGFLKGVGKGLGGLVLKPTAGMTCVDVVRTLTDLP